MIVLTSYYTILFEKGVDFCSPELCTADKQLFSTGCHKYDLTDMEERELLDEKLDRCKHL